MARKYIRHTVDKPVQPEVSGESPGESAEESSPQPAQQPDTTGRKGRTRRSRRPSSRPVRMSREGFSASPQFRAECQKLHRSLMERCYNEKARSYAKYGALGIKVCELWHEYPQFEWWCYTHGFLPSEDGKAQVWLYRNDSQGDYTPENCRFGEPYNTLGNSQPTHDITAFGETKSLIEWAKDPRCMVNAKTLESRVNRCNWLESYGAEYTLTTPPHRNRKLYEAFGDKMTIRLWSKDVRCKVSYDVLTKRLQRGMDPEAALTTPAIERRSKRRSSKSSAPVEQPASELSAPAEEQTSEMTA